MTVFMFQGILKLSLYLNIRYPGEKTWVKKKSRLSIKTWKSNSLKIIILAELCDTVERIMLKNIFKTIFF